jgi:hypothetical protein
MDKTTSQDVLSQVATHSLQFNKPLWELGITELAGRNLESAGRNEVNDMLQHGWMLLHIYTLRYPDRQNPRGPRYVWRERPMAILGRHS